MPSPLARWTADSLVGRLTRDGLPSAACLNGVERCHDVTKRSTGFGFCPPKVVPKGVPVVSGRANFEEGEAESPPVDFAPHLKVRALTLLNYPKLCREGVDSSCLVLYLFFSCHGSVASCWHQETLRPSSDRGG
jgi:hypothetical protein